MFKCRFLALASVTIASPLFAQATTHTDPQAIDLAVETFTAAKIGAEGGAVRPFDRRVRLAGCDAPLSLYWHTPRMDLVRIECPAPVTWQVFVPVKRKQEGAVRSAPDIKRGQVVSVEFSGPGFSITQQGEAMENGSSGDWIKIRPAGSTATLPGKIEPTGVVTVQLR